MLEEAWSSEIVLECRFTCINIMFLDEGIRYRILEFQFKT